MMLVPLTQGKFATVDDEDAPRVLQFNWCAARHRDIFYAVRTYWESGHCITVYMHQFIMGAARGVQVHHKDGDGCNNQKYNLRPGTQTQNRRGFLRKQKDATSPYRGVSWYARDQNWYSAIQKDRKKISLGFFDCPEEAARARDAKAREWGWPEDGMNFPQ